MTEADGKAGAKPTGQNDPLSATGMFLDAFHRHSSAAPALLTAIWVGVRPGSESQTIG